MLRHLKGELPRSFDEVIDYISKYQVDESTEIGNTVKELARFDSESFEIKKPEECEHHKLICSIYNSKLTNSISDTLLNNPNEFYSVDQLVDSPNGFDKCKATLISMFLCKSSKAVKAIIAYDPIEKKVRFSFEKLIGRKCSHDDWEYYRFPKQYFTKDDGMWKTSEEKVIELVKKLQDPLCEYLFTSEYSRDIFLTEELSQSIRSVEDLTIFTKGITLLRKHLDKWYSEDRIRHHSDPGGNNQNYKSTPIILGTVDEVIKRRNEIKGVTSDNDFKEDLSSLKLKLIHAISSNESCDNIDKIHDLMQEYKQICEKIFVRYAYYMSKRCREDIEALNIG